MTPQQALDTLNALISQIEMNRDGHQRAANAINVLQPLIAGKPVEPVPVPVEQALDSSLTGKSSRGELKKREKLKT